MIDVGGRIVGNAATTPLVVDLLDRYLQIWPDALEIECLDCGFEVMAYELHAGVCVPCRGRYLKDPDLAPKPVLIR